MQPFLLLPRPEIENKISHPLRHTLPFHSGFHMGVRIPAVLGGQPGQPAGGKHPHQVLPEPLFFRPFFRQGLLAAIRTPSGHGIAQLQQMALAGIIAAYHYIDSRHELKMFAAGKHRHAAHQ